MNAESQELLKSVTKMADITEAAKSCEDFVGGVTVEGGVVGQSDSDLFLAVDGGITFSIPATSILRIANSERPLLTLPGKSVSLRIKNGTRITSTQVLEVGKDLVAPVECHPACKDPRQCKNACCCDGRVCKYGSCVNQ